MRRKRLTQTPRMTVSKFDSKCAETGKMIKKGQSCLYYPEDKKVYHPDSEQAYQWRMVKDDETMLGQVYEEAAPYGAALPYPPVSKLENIADVLRFFQVLVHEHRVSIHPDDDFADYVRKDSDDDEPVPFYTPQQAAELNQMMKLCFNICDDFETEGMGYSHVEQPNLIYVLCIWASEDSPTKFIMLSSDNHQTNDFSPEGLGLIKISIDKALAPEAFFKISNASLTATGQGYRNIHIDCSPFHVEYFNKQGEAIEFRAYIEDIVIQPILQTDRKTAITDFYLQSIHKNDFACQVETGIFRINAMPFSLTSVTTLHEEWEFTF